MGRDLLEDLWAITDATGGDVAKVSLSFDEVSGRSMLTAHRPAASSIVTAYVSADQLEAAAAVARAFERKHDAAPVITFRAPDEEAPAC